MMSEMSRTDRDRLRGLLLEGAESPPAGAADAEYFDQLREERVQMLNAVLADITADGGGLRMVDRLTRESIYDRNAR